MNPNPYKARLVQRRKRQAGDLHKLTKAVWQGIRDCELAAEMAETVAEKCQVVHAMAAIANTYARLLQYGEYEGRIVYLERSLEGLRHGQVHGALLNGQVHGGAG